MADLKHFPFCQTNKHFKMKFRNLLSITLLIASFSLVFTACKKDETTPTETDPTTGYLKLASGNATGSGLKLEVYATDSAYTGYNKWYIAVKDSATNAYVENAQISLAPNMNMMTMSHAAPFENPSVTAVNKLFPCSVSFIMSSMGGTWTVAITVTNTSTSKSGTATFTINVKDPSPAKMFSFISLVDNTSKYFVGFIPPAKPIVGINDFEIVVYKKQSMMMFPADSSLSVTFIPTMPTMGHSSPNNVDPVHIGKGHYKGKVNFTMTGLWRLSYNLKLGTAVADSTHYFDFNF